MEVALCKRPSYAWRSILSSRDLLSEGLIWKIGDGKTANIWKDRWVPIPITYSIQSQRRILSDDAKVVEIIDPDTRWWNKPLITAIFNHEEVEIICNIPLSRYGQPDVLRWQGTTSGEFTVRSAYHLEKEKQERLRGESSTAPACTRTWKTIWSLNVPNSVKMFLWRACNDLLPTKVNLGKKRYC
jgi:hypothetical protein